MKDGEEVLNLREKPLLVLDTKDGLTIAGARLAEGLVDIRAGNGYVHALEEVIFPFESVDEMVEPVTRK